MNLDSRTERGAGEYVGSADGNSLMVAKGKGRGEGTQLDDAPSPPGAIDLIGVALIVLAEMRKKCGVGVPNEGDAHRAGAATFEHVVAIMDEQTLRRAGKGLLRMRTLRRIDCNKTGHEKYPKSTPPSPISSVPRPDTFRPPAMRSTPPSRTSRCVLPSQTRCRQSNGTERLRPWRFRPKPSATPFRLPRSASPTWPKRLVSTPNCCVRSRPAIHSPRAEAAAEVTAMHCVSRRATCCRLPTGIKLLRAARPKRRRSRRRQQAMSFDHMESYAPQRSTCYSKQNRLGRERSRRFRPGLSTLANLSNPRRTNTLQPTGG